MQSLPLQRNIAVQGSLQQGKATACAILRPLIDGYNWRKYNEIIPPGTTSPRVFYGCTNMGCIARKIEEHSPTGHVRHIYEGSHNHLQPRKAMALIRSCRKRKLSYRELEKGRLRVDGQWYWGLLDIVKAQLSVDDLPPSLPSQDHKKPLVHR